MEIIKNNIEDLMIKTGYEYKDRYPYDELSNKYFNYWMLFEEKKDEIQKLLGVSIATILYSQFYWSQHCISRLEKIGDLDSGSMQEYRFHVFDDMEEIEDIDWDEVGEVGEAIQQSMK